jgi:hypothetical protein
MGSMFFLHGKRILKMKIWHIKAIIILTTLIITMIMDVSNIQIWKPALYD